MKGLLQFVLTPICRPTCILFAIQRWTCWVLLCGTTGWRKLCPKTADFGRYDQFSDLAYTEAGEQCNATKSSRQVLLSFPSQSSKFRVLLHFADVIARRHSQAITWSMFGHTWTEFTQHLALYQSSYQWRYDDSDFVNSHNNCSCHMKSYCFVVL